jgi:GT2 family glycosyltransferase
VTSVLANEHPSFDLTIIDQSTNDETRVAVEKVAADDDRVHYVHVDEPGLSRAYNNGIRRTSNDIIAFTDDDCIAPSDWLANVDAAFASDPEAELLYGQVVAAGLAEGDEMLTPQLEVTHRQRLSKQDGFKIFGMGANFAARRRLFDRIGGFDEALGGGGPLWSSQDFDLAYRTYHAGAVILLEPSVIIRHDGRRELEDWPSLLKAYGSGDGAFYLKHVRCRDPYATWLFAKRMGTTTAKWAVKTVLRRPNEGPYLAGVWRGMRASLKFDVDRQTRLYVDRRGE